MRATLGAYVRERMPVAIFGPAIALLTLAAVWTAGSADSLRAWTMCGGLIALMVLQFRLWDDVEDRERDRTDHPDRLVVRTDAAPFRIWIAALASFSLLASLLAGGVGTFVGVVALNTAALAAYRAVRRQVAPVVWRFVILLAKYPAFVAVAASAVGDLRADRAVPAAALAYLSACIYEAVHTRVATAGVHS